MDWQIIFKNDNIVYDSLDDNDSMFKNLMKIKFALVNPTSERDQS